MPLGFGFNINDMPIVQHDANPSRFAVLELAGGESKA